jgi:DNA polymerase-3 subunit delta'
MLFAQVIGQQAVKDRLVRSVKDNRVSHAQLFMGPEGSGALPLALAYAQFLLCQNKQENDACGVCPSCVKAAKLEHPDLHFSFPIVKEARKVEKSDDRITEFRKALIAEPYMNLTHFLAELDEESKRPIIGTEEAGSIIHKLNYKSYEGEYKILIMWMAELMNDVAANNLLKIIEEPPDQTLFILVAENAEAILPTILSRTQLIKIHAIGDEDMREVLTRDHSIPDEEAYNVSVLAEGNYWMARTLLMDLEDSGFSMQTFREWMLLCHRKNIGGMFNWIDDFAGFSKEQQRNFLKYAMHIFRQCIVGTYTDNVLLRAREDEADFIRKFAQFVHGYNIVPLMQEFNKAHYYLDRNANPKLVFTQLSFRVITLMFPK